MSNSILRSYQVFGADDAVLAAAADAVKDAAKDAKAHGKVQRIVLTRKGYRQDIEVGDIYVVPASVCKNAKDFPGIILHANLRKSTSGEGMVEFKMGMLLDPEELSDDALKGFKDLVFKDSKGESASLVVFAPAWAHPSDFLSFPYEEGSLMEMLREVAYSSPFNPSLSSVFDQLRAIDPDQAPTARITPGDQHIFKINPSEKQDYPKFVTGLDAAPAEGGKKASVGKRPVIRLLAKDLAPVEGEIPITKGELALFQDLGKEVKAITTTKPLSARAAALKLADGDEGLGDIAAANPGMAVDSTPEPEPAQKSAPQQQEPQQGTAPGGLPAAAPAAEAGAGAGAAEAGAASTVEAAAPLLALASAGKKAEKQQGTYNDPEFGKGRALRAVPDYGDEGTKERVSPADVDGPCPMTASAKDEGKGITEVGLSEDTPERTTEKVQDASHALTDITTAPVRVVTAAWAPDTLKAVNLVVSDYAGRSIPGESLVAVLKKLTDDIKSAIICMRDQGLLVQEGANFFKVLSPDHVADEAAHANPTGGPQDLSKTKGYISRRDASWTIKSAKTKEVWAAEDLDGLKLGGYWSKEASEAAIFRSAAAAQDEIRRNRLHVEAAEICHECGKGCTCKPKKTAGNWWNPGSVIEQFYPELQHDVAQSPLIEQVATPDINATGLSGAAPGKGTSADPAATGLAQGLENNSSVPLRQENSFYGPDYSRNFYAPHTDIDPEALTFKHEKAEPDEPDANSMDLPKAAAKKADGALSLFRGLQVAEAEEDSPEHPQAHFDETVGDPVSGEYIEPEKNDSVPQDTIYKNVDHLLKSVVGGYAAQLISAFQATSKPLHFDAPFKDTLDLEEVMRMGNPTCPEDVHNAAIAQLKSAMDSLSTDQKKMLMNSAVAQAAVWCTNTEGSGGYNYEVFVRAESLEDTKLIVTIVTGRK